MSVFVLLLLARILFSTEQLKNGFLTAAHLAAAVGEDPAPCNAHAVVLHSHGLHQRHILLEPEITEAAGTDSLELPSSAPCYYNMVGMGSACAHQHQRQVIMHVGQAAT
jgi:hypothetical protein